MVESLKTDSVFQMLQLYRQIGPMQLWRTAKLLYNALMRRKKKKRFYCFLMFWVFQILFQVFLEQMKIHDKVDHELQNIGFQG